MTQIAFIFPGQGSQKVGMGSELVQTYPIAREVFDEADQFLSKPLSQLCFEGPEADLIQTENTQLAILTCSVATLKILTQFGIAPEIVAGHSLGEYTALVASEVLKFTDALRLVSARAQFMAEAGHEQNGTMAAILGMDAEQLNNLCEKVDGTVQIANYNCPGQLVISGEVNAVNKVVSLASAEIGTRRCRPLPVSGAFHSQLMAPAQYKFKEVLNSVTLHPPKKKIVMNVTGDIATQTDNIKDLILQQITQPVQWEKTLHSIEKTGISDFIEIGPGKVLSGLVKRTFPESKSVNVENNQSLKLVKDEYGNGG